MRKVLTAFVETLEEKDRIIEDMRGAKRELSEYIRSREKEYEEAKAEFEKAKDEINTLKFHLDCADLNIEELKSELAVYKGESEVNEDDDF